MDAGDIEALIERLVANPHDADALARAHAEGASDPQAYAYLLEQVGTRTQDPSYASHWLSEAANIWSVSLGDAHRAARVLMLAVDRDPSQPLAADRLAQLYRDKGDVKALVAMLDRRVRLLTPMLSADPGNDSLRALVAGLHEELGKAWNDPPLDQPRKAIDHYKRAIEIDPGAAFAIFSAREIYKALQAWDDAIAMYALELAVERDPERRLMLLRDEAATRRLAGDLEGVTSVLRTALEEVRAAGGDDPALAQEVAGSLLDRADARASLGDEERAYGADLLAGLAEAFGGEHGIAYTGGALDLLHGHDRAMQLFAYYASKFGMPEQRDSIALRYHAYLEANPDGALAAEARLHLSGSYEALGQLMQAIQVLEPMRSHPDVAHRISALRGKGALAPTPVAGVEEVRIVERELALDPEPVVDTDEVAVEPPPPDAEEVKSGALAAARASLGKSDKAGALKHYTEALAVDACEPEALSWVEDYLRTKRDYAKLRDVLWASARAMTSHDSVESKKLRLREIAGLSESNLKDLDGAIQAWRQVLSIDRGDDVARQALVRALEKGQRWDDLANAYEQEANTSSDVDAKIQLEKKLATLHEQKRNDLVAAAEAWGRIASMTPDDEDAVTTAADLYEKAKKPELAAGIIQERVDDVKDAAARATLLDRLGELLSRAGDHAAAGRAYERAAGAVPTEARWVAAEKAHAEANEHTAAAAVLEKLAELAVDAKAKAEAIARASEHLEKSGDDSGATACLERAHELVPDAESYTRALLDRYRASDAQEKLTSLLVARGDGHPDKDTRVAALREAAKLFEAVPENARRDDSRAQWQKILAAGEDAEALEHLARIAVDTGDPKEGASLVRRMGELATTSEEKLSLAMREAELLAASPDGIPLAVARYESILTTLDAKNRTALRAIADLEQKRGEPKAAANALERELALTTDKGERREIGARLVASYEEAKDDAGRYTALEVVRDADPEDFDALNRLVVLAEKLERWEPLAALLPQQIEVEADDTEISALTLKLSSILADKLSRGDDALAALQELADAGDDLVREAYVALGDRLGWKGIVATKLVDWWFQAPVSEGRSIALVGAFERFGQVERDADAVRVGIEILRTKRDSALAVTLEELAAKISNEAGLTAAQEILGLNLSGAERAAELVRQAEMRVRAGMAWAESVQHGETALGGLTPEETEPLLVRLAALCPTPVAVVDLYERQVSRSRGGEAREKALIRAAQVAGERGELQRARTFFDLAVAGTPSDATLDALARAAKDADGEKDGLRRTLAEALAHGGEGVRDGGRARSSFLRRAALLAHHELHDVDQAFAWLTESLVAHADAATLDALAAIADEIKAPRRVDDVLTHVLTEVFDGPLVRLLLARRAKVRKEVLDDRSGAAADLKKLHDLSPTDEAVMTELAALLTELGDHRSMVQLYEDQLLRSKDHAVRAELGRKVAQIWETELADPREAADAWRRVLRLKPGDEEATHGLERAKTNMLKKGPALAPTPSAPPTETKPKSRTVPPATALSPPASAAETPLVPPAAAAPTTEPPPPPIPEASSSVQDVDDAELEAEPAPPPAAAGHATSQLEKLLGSTDPFAEHDTTHTSIDVRPTLAAARALEGLPAPASSASPLGAPRSGRPSKPPPLPSPYELNEPPTSPGRRMDGPARNGPARQPGSDRALAMTDENPALEDAPDPTAVGEIPEFFRKGKPEEVPPDVLSASDLAALADDETGDVLVVDEFVEDVDDEFEDVASPSKPPNGPPPQ